MAKRLGLSSAEQSAHSRIRLAQEQALAQQLAGEGYTVYSPTAVCDRIAVKGGLVFFVEFKKGRQKLRPGQQAIQDLVPDRYLIIRHGK
jgi:hypothetical protein